MITPRRTTLTTVPGLRALHRSIAGLCPPADVWLARATVVLVPTRTAGHELRRTLENLWLVAPPPGAAPGVVVFPDVLTRADWYRRLSESACAGARVLSDIEREALLAASARDAAATGSNPPFRMRPGLVAEMLRFYDTLRRRQKTVADFERLVLEDLEPRAEFDRGAERLLRQTRFLAAAFRAFEERLVASGALDEHILRQQLLGDTAGGPIRRVILTMGDRVSDPSAGLYPADFDLLARIPHLESIDIVATRAALLAGLGERLRDLLPGIEEQACGESEPPPSLILPPGGQGRLHVASRDREEELRNIARRIKCALRQRPAGVCGPARVGVVFRRPLPYVYLGRTIFDAARVEWQASDALPLAAEPFAAAVDLVLSVVTARFARRQLVQLLRSPHFRFDAAGVEASPAGIGALDRALAEAGYLGDLDRLRSFAEAAAGPAAAAARVSVAVAEELAPLAVKAPASAHLSRLLSFVRAHERLDAAGDEDTRSRHLRARAAVLRIAEDMRAAAVDFDDPVVRIADLAASVRRWIESHTFTPAGGSGGVRLVDAQSARYGDFDEVHLAGLVAGDWPEASPRDIFYPPFLLARLGWPKEAERVAAERAAFADLLRLARERVSVSSFTLEDDAIVEPSPLLEDLERAGLSGLPEGEARVRVFVDEALMGDAVDTEPLAPEATEWAALRSSRTPASEPQFHGHARLDPMVRSSRPSRPHTVTGIDRYLECPFKYFAATVLNLPEEPPDEQGMSPKERGRFVHEVFRAFFSEWQARGGRAIAVDHLDEARALFEEVAVQRLGSLPPSEAALERLRLLGSVAAPGLGEVVLAAEAARPSIISERLLEFAFDANVDLEADEVRRTVRLRGKADRVDLLADGRFRVIDYKIGRPPEDSIQLPIYTVCLAQHFAREGRARAGAEAFYVAFGDRRNPVQPVVGDGATSAAVVEQAQRRAIEAIDGIERGEFPPRPASPRLCATCAHAGVCRKDYVVAD